MQEARKRVLDKSWSSAADLYLRELVPRFTPWFLDGLDCLIAESAHLPKECPVIIPCCGPGHEIPVVFRALGGRHRVHGSDLAHGMVQLANSVIQADCASNPAQEGHDRDPALLAARAVAGAAAHRFPHLNLIKQGSPGPAESTTTRVSGSTGHNHHQHQLMQAVQGDACLLDEQYQGQAAAVFSVFGLQQLGPLAPQALACWCRCLAPGGVCVVVLWPTDVEDLGGPWWAWDVALKQKLAREACMLNASTSVSTSSPETQLSMSGTSKQPSLPLPLPQPPPVAEAVQTNAGRPGLLRTEEEWERNLTQVALQEVPGCVLLQDKLITHDMVWSDTEHFWQVMTYGGPWRARRDVSGDAFMEDLKMQWFQIMRQHTIQQSPSNASSSHVEGPSFASQCDNLNIQQGCAAKLVHSPCARLIVIKRQGGAVAKSRF